MADTTFRENTTKSAFPIWPSSYPVGFGWSHIPGSAQAVFPTAVPRWPTPIPGLDFAKRLPFSG